MNASRIAIAFDLLRRWAARRTPLLWVAPAALLVGNVAAAQVGTDVITRSGPVQGQVAAAQGVLAFRGIPYAAPPVGNQRWREPGPAPRWSAHRPALQNGPACPQPRGFFAHPHWSTPCPVAR